MWALLQPEEYTMNTFALIATLSLTIHTNIGSEDHTTTSVLHNFKSMDLCEIYIPLLKAQLPAQFASYVSDRADPSQVKIDLACKPE